jgi:hypothetical protein
MTSLVRRRIEDGVVMGTFDINSSALIAIAVLVSLAKLVHVLFATLRICVREYYSFRVWFRNVRASSNGKHQQ